MDNVLAAAVSSSSSGEVQRRKPLRTYSKKRPHSIVEPREPPAEKRRRSSPSPDLPELPLLKDVPRLPVPPPTSSFEKGSILNYFKPSRSSSSVSASSDGKKNSSPPTSPIALKTRRTPRRLRLRPSTPLIAAFDEDLDEHDTDEHEISKQSAVSLRNPGVRSDPITGDQSLKDTSATRLNERASTNPPLVGPETLPKKPARSKSTPIQTTINLSTKPAFQECKVCHIVYNPLHPSDVKYHAKRHKAIMRTLSSGK